LRRATLPPPADNEQTLGSRPEEHVLLMPLCLARYYCASRKLLSRLYAR